MRPNAAAFTNTDWSPLALIFMGETLVYFPAQFMEIVCPER
jgi:hypothetical protein